MLSQNKVLQAQNDIHQLEIDIDDLLNRAKKLKNRQAEKQKPVYIEQEFPFIDYSFDEISQKAENLFDNIQILNKDIDSKSNDLNEGVVISENKNHQIIHDSNIDQENVVIPETKFVQEKGDVRDQDSDIMLEFSENNSNIKDESSLFTGVIVVSVTNRNGETKSLSLKNKKEILKMFNRRVNKQSNLKQINRNNNKAEDKALIKPKHSITSKVSNLFKSLLKIFKKK